MPILATRPRVRARWAVRPGDVRAVEKDPSPARHFLIDGLTVDCTAPVAATASGLKPRGISNTSCSLGEPWRMACAAIDRHADASYSERQRSDYPSGRNRV